MDPNCALLTDPFQVSDITRSNPQGADNNGSNLDLEKTTKRRAKRRQKAMEEAEKEAGVDEKVYLCPRCKNTFRTAYSYAYHMTTHQIEDRKVDKKKYNEAMENRLKEVKIWREQQGVARKQKLAEVRMLKKAAALSPTQTIGRGALYVKGIRQNDSSYNYTGGLPVADHRPLT